MVICHPMAPRPRWSPVQRFFHRSRFPGKRRMSPPAAAMTARTVKPSTGLSSGPGICSADGRMRLANDFFRRVAKTEIYLYKIDRDILYIQQGTGMTRPLRHHGLQGRRTSGLTSTRLEKSMAHFHSAIDATQPVADRARARRKTLHKVLNGTLFAAAFLFVVAVVCGLLP